MVNLVSHVFIAQEAHRQLNNALSVTAEINRRFDTGYYVRPATTFDAVGDRYYRSLPMLFGRGVVGTTIHVRRPVKCWQQKTRGHRNRLMYCAQPKGHPKGRHSWDLAGR